jgi:hypothetical protein
MKIVYRCDALARVFVTVAAGALLMAAIAGPAMAQKAQNNQNGQNNSNSLQFKGGIGVHPISAVTGCPPDGSPCLTDPTDTTPPAPPPPAGPTVSFNIVDGVHPAGQIWVINDLVATVSSGGSIKVNGKGLVLAGGNNAGRAPTPALSVIATLICDLPTTAIPVPPQFSTASAGVLLSPTGDFQINDKLSPLPPAACTSPMLLIRNAATAAGGFPNPWFAVGIYSPKGS